MHVASFNDDGFALIANAISSTTIAALDSAFPTDTHNHRNVLLVPAVRELATSPAIRALISPDHFAVRATFFNKLPDANWKVPWHQDTTIAVRERREVPGFGPWSVKEGVPHVRPPAQLLEDMVAVRIHIDDCDADNAPLRFIPGSHSRGLLTDDEIQHYPKESVVTLTAKRGDVILMRPLILHASSPATKPASRRVLHIEFASENLPQGLDWAFRNTCATVTSQPDA